MKAIVIIPREGKNSSKFFQDEISDNKKDITLLNEYIKVNSINLEEESSMYIQGVLMAIMGYCVIEINDNILSAYIPKNITLEQYEWFDFNKSKIRKYYINAEIIANEDEIIQIRRQSNNSSPLVKLYSKLYEILERGNNEDDNTRSKQFCKRNRTRVAR